MTLTIERPVDVVDAVATKFLEDVPEWAAAHRDGDELIIHELGRCTWRISRRRIERAIERLAENEQLKNIELNDPARAGARKLQKNPFSPVSSRTAGIVIQVAVFGELEYA